MARADDPYALVYVQLYATVFNHFARVSARAAKAVARDAGCSEAYLSMIGKARKLPTLEMSARLDPAIGADGCLYEVRRLIERIQDQVAVHGRNLETRPQPSGQEEDEMKRRAALQILGTLSAGAAIPPGVLENILGGVERATGTVAGIDEWHQVVDEYGYLLSRTPVGSYLADLSADVVAVGDALDRASSPAERNGLLRVSASLTALLAIEFGDLANRRAARMSWTAARHAADASGDRPLQVWVRGREAQEAYWLGLPNSYVTARAEEAIGIAAGTPCSGLPRALCVQSWLAADAGNATKAREALNAHAEVFEQLPDKIKEDQGSFGWTEAKYRWDEAYTYTLISDKNAARSLDQAFALFPPDTLGPVANLQVMRAIGMIASREIDTGLASVLMAVQGTPLSAARLNMTRQVLRALPKQAQALPAARELRALTSGQT